MSALGISSGLLVHTVLAAFGLSAILATSAFAFTVVKTAGAAYLIYLGFRMLRRSAGTVATPDVRPVGSWRVYWQGVATNTLNPKVAIYAVLVLWLERISGCLYIALGLNLLRSKPQPA